MVCSQCGATFTPGMGFCTNCGAAVSTSTTPRPAAPPAATPQAPTATPPPQAPVAQAPPVAATPIAPTPPVFAAPVADYGPRADVKAIFSLILGIFAIVPFSIFAGIPAIILGHLAQRDIRNSNGKLTGSGMALTGLVLGYLSIVILIALIAIPNIIRANMNPSVAPPLGNLRTIMTAEVTYATMYPERGYARDLAALGPGPGGCTQASAEHACLIDDVLGAPNCTSGSWCYKAGYRYGMVANCPENMCTNFIATAAPAGRGRSFCVTSDGVLREHSGETITTPLIDPSQCAAWAPVE